MASDSSLLRTFKVKDEKLPSLIVKAIEFFLSEGVTPWLVGGIVRDRYLTGNWGEDWDFELHTQKSYKDSEWENYLHKLSEKFVEHMQSHANVNTVSSEELNFAVYRYRIQTPTGDSYALEVCGPRLEIFPEKEDGAYGHCDFEVSFDSSMKADKSFLRRDFTVNALAFEFYQDDSDDLCFVLVDPYGGLDDLEQKLLRPCSQEHFYKDPVRALRALRFHHKLGFSLEDIDFSRFELVKLTTHYVLEEGRKSRDAQFFRDFFQLVGQKEMALSPSVMKLSALVYLERPFTNAKDALVDLIENCEKTGLPFERMEKLGKVLGIKKNWVKALIELKKCAPPWEKFVRENPQVTLQEHFKTEWEDNSLEEIVKDPIFFNLKKILPGVSILLAEKSELPGLENLFPLKMAEQLRPLLEIDPSTRDKAKVLLEEKSLAITYHQHVIWYLTLVN